MVDAEFIPPQEMLPLLLDEKATNEVKGWSMALVAISSDSCCSPSSGCHALSWKFRH